MLIMCTFRDSDSAESGEAWMTTTSSDDSLRAQTSHRLMHTRSIASACEDPSLRIDSIRLETRRTSMFTRTDQSTESLYGLNDSRSHLPPLPKHRLKPLGCQAQAHSKLKSIIKPMTTAISFTVDWDSETALIACLKEIHAEKERLRRPSREARGIGGPP